MLESLRRNQRLQHVVAALFSVLVLTAMLSGVWLRAAVTQPPKTSPAANDICSVHSNASRAQPVGDEAFEAVADDAPATPAQHDGAAHHGPECLLCVAMAPPEAVQVVRYQPPRPASLTPWEYLPSASFADAPARTPLPPRGPPSGLV